MTRNRHGSYECIASNELDAHLSTVVLHRRSRWSMEQMLGFGKSELGVEGVRMHSWAARQKLLAIAALSYAFLVPPLAGSATLLSAILRFAHRTARQAH